MGETGAGQQFIMEFSLISAIKWDISVQRLAGHYTTYEFHGYFSFIYMLDHLPSVYIATWFHPKFSFSP
uniref:Uncharacterized protein n=1 Tax=Rhizophora mucronata TaxID=61149 RepID=A0A2P2NIH0_RHIMU